MDARTAAAEAALLTPASVRIGRYDVRMFSGGDMLLASRLGLTLASGRAEAIAAMTAAEQSAELLQMAALCCHAPDALKSAVFTATSGDALRERFVVPVIFSLTPAETNQLIAHVARFFSAAADLALEVEPRPDPGTPPSPAGK